MTEQQINAKLDALDKMIAEETNASTLATLSRCYQKLKDDPSLGCKNKNPDGSPTYCCTFAVVAIPERTRNERFEQPE